MEHAFCIIHPILLFTAFSCLSINLKPKERIAFVEGSGVLKVCLSNKVSLYSILFGYFTVA